MNQLRLSVTTAVDQLRPYAGVLARIMIVAIFFANGFGIINQSVAVHVMIARGMPAELAPAFVMAGRAVQIFAGVGLALGLYRRTSALALIAFLIPATLIGHPFWLEPGQLFQVQLLNFLKNMSMIGGLLFIATTNPQTPGADLQPVCSGPAEETAGVDPGYAVR